MDKKLTDNEIVKALEEHYKQVDKGYSTHIEYGGKGDEQEEKYLYMLRDTLDLINRLQEENEQKDRAFENLIEVARLWKEKYNNAKKELFEQKFKNNMLYETAKEIEIKAYKECIENAKEELYEWVGADNSIPYTRIKKVLNNLLKELGENDGKSR